MRFTYSNHNTAARSWCRTAFAMAMLLSTFFSACKKDEIAEKHPASLQLLNAMNDGLTLRVNMSGNHPIRYSEALLLSNYGMYVQNNDLIPVINFPQRIDFYAGADTMPHNSPVLSTTLHLEEGKIYSLFIHGDKNTAAYSLFQDNIPPIKRDDSVTHIRFANFSETQAISVNIKGEAIGSFIQNLHYKSLADFIEMKADHTVPDYEFEIRDQSTGTLLATFVTEYLATRASPFSPNEWLNKSHTLVVTGKAGGSGSNAIKVIKMSHR